MGLFLYLDKYFLTSKIKIRQPVSDMIVKNAGSMEPRVLWGLGGLGAAWIRIFLLLSLVSSPPFLVHCSFFSILSVFLFHTGFLSHPPVLVFVLPIFIIPIKGVVPACVYVTRQMLVVMCARDDF